MVKLKGNKKSKGICNRNWTDLCPVSGTLVRLRIVAQWTSPVHGESSKEHFEILIKLITLGITQYRILENMK